MGKRAELIGERFNRLTVESFSGIVINKFSRGKAYWVCKCDCGGYTKSSSAHLKNGSVKSCGCLRSEGADKARLIRDKNALNRGDYPGFQTFLDRTKRGAKARDIEWGLSADEVRLLTSQNCIYCGQIPSQIVKSRRSFVLGGEYVHNGIDRTDSSKGYNIENCVPCCKWCNYAKLDRSLEDFKSWVKKVYCNLYV